MSRRLGLNFRAACRRIDPQLYQKLYPDTPSMRDVQDRLKAIENEIDAISQQHKFSTGTARMTGLLDERRKLRELIAQAEGKHQPARHVPTRKRRESEGSRP